MTQDPDVAEEAGEEGEQVVRGGGNIVNTSLSGLDLIIMILVIVIAAALILTLFYGRQMLSNIGIGLVGSGVSPLEALFSGIGTAITAFFTWLAHLLNPGGYVITHVYLQYKIVEGVLAFKAHIVLLIQ